MSYGVMFGLFCLTPPIGRFFKSIKFDNGFSRTLDTSVSASIAAAPLSSYYFGGFSWIAPVANFFAIPLTVVIVVFTGLFAIASLFPPIASVFAFIPQAAVLALVFLNSLLADAANFTLMAPLFPVWAAMACFVVIFICSDYVFIKAKIKAVFGIALVAALFFGVAVPQYNLYQKPLEITILDVGTGDLVHVHTQEKDALLDNGGTLQRSRLADYTENAEIVYDIAVVTNDKTQNLTDLIEQGSIKELMVPENYEPKYEDSLVPLAHYSLYDTMDLNKDVSVTAIAEDGKNYSFVVRYKGEDICVVLNNKAEDIEYDSSAACVKIAKGGAEGTVDGRLLDAIRSDVMVVSVKAYNRQDLPDEGTIGMMEEDGKTIITTAQSGAVTLLVDAQGNVEIETMK